MSPRVPRIFFPGSQAGALPPPPPEPPQSDNRVLLETTDRAKTISAAQSLGADEVKVAYDISTTPTSMDDDIGAYANAGIRVFLQATFTGRIPTVAEAQNVSAWPNRFGFGGTFWLSRTDPQMAVLKIEFGHDTSYNYQYAA